MREGITGYLLLLLKTLKNKLLPQLISRIIPLCFFWHTTVSTSTMLPPLWDTSHEAWIPVTHRSAEYHFTVASRSFGVAITVCGSRMNQEVVTEPRVVGDWREEVSTGKVGAAAARRADTFNHCSSRPAQPALNSTILRKIFSAPSLLNSKCLNPVSASSFKAQSWLK